MNAFLSTLLLPNLIPSVSHPCLGLHFGMYIFLVLRNILGTLPGHSLYPLLGLSSRLDTLPIKNVACMLFFILNFLDECTGRYVPSLCTYHYCLRIYGNLSFPCLRKRS